MAGFTDETSEEVFECYFQGQDITAPSTVHVGLHDGDPNATGDDAEPGDQNEFDAGDYSRASVTASGSNWTTSKDGTANVITNDTLVDFGTASSSWGTATHFSYNAGSGSSAQVIAVGELDASEVVNENDEVAFEEGDLEAELD